MDQQVDQLIFIIKASVKSYLHKCSAMAGSFYINTADGCWQLHKTHVHKEHQNTIQQHQKSITMTAQKICTIFLN